MNHLYEQLTALKLTGFRDALKKQLAQPGTYQELGFEERLSLLTAEELTCRENRKAERLIKHARFRLNAELSKLDYRNNRGLDRALIRSLSQGNWLTLDLMYQRGSIIVVSQLPVENWYKMIGDSTHADAILDRLVHGSIKIELKGESMRKIQSPLTEGDQ
ncbi:ATP-binding protein [Escherichia coli]|uniref:ATP-binding protein n=1 Tax=Escherichia coli TaxID=562 RepID=UPI00336254E4